MLGGQTSRTFNKRGQPTRIKHTDAPNGRQYPPHYPHHTMCMHSPYPRCSTYTVLSRGSRHGVGRARIRMRAPL